MHQVGFIYKIIQRSGIHGQKNIKSGRCMCLFPWNIKQQLSNIMVQQPKRPDSSNVTWWKLQITFLIDKNILISNYFFFYIYLSWWFMIDFYEKIKLEHFYNIWTSISMNTSQYYLTKGIGGILFRIKFWCYVL